MLSVRTLLTPNAAVGQRPGSYKGSLSTWSSPGDAVTVLRVQLAVLLVLA
jgi:hypothetical protein